MRKRPRGAELRKSRDRRGPPRAVDEGAISNKRSPSRRRRDAPRDRRGRRIALAPNRAKQTLVRHTVSQRAAGRRVCWRRRMRAMPRRDRGDLPQAFDGALARADLARELGTGWATEREQGVRG